MSLGGDTDTLACITGGIAETLYGLPQGIALEARGHLDAHVLDIVDRFYARLAEPAD